LLDHLCAKVAKWSIGYF